MLARRVLVTGSSGRLGKYVCERLLSERGIQLLPLPGPGSGGPSLADSGSVQDIVKEYRPWGIIHLASLVGEACAANPELAQAVNVEATKVLSSAAVGSGTRMFLFASSAAVYGDKHKEPIAESAAPNPISIYGKTKYEAEQELNAIDLGQMRALCFRIFNIYGNGFDSSLVNRLISSDPASPVRLAGLDHFVRDYIDAADVAGAFVAGLDYSGSASVLNVGTGEAITNRELISRLERRAQINYEIGPELDSYSVADPRLAETEINFMPKKLG